MVDVGTFKDVIDASDNGGARHLLLGNGFSIACVPSIFSYTSLYESADFGVNSQLSDVFDKLKTKDFEEVVRALESSRGICSVYDPRNSALLQNLRNDAERLKEVLLHTIAKKHPRLPSDIDECKYFACKKFLSHFISEGMKTGRVYTLNYDLLLYWTLMNDSAGNGESIKLLTDDGFGRERETPGEYVQWKNNPSTS